MERKLASIQYISNILEHPNADRLEIAQVEGWKVIVGKDEFRKGDLAIYIECDAVLPDGPEWSEFMRSKKFRVKTIRLRGETSQGLLLPLNILPEEYLAKPIEIDTDVTNILNIKKYEPTVFNQGARLGRSISHRPSYIPKTDEIRLQSKLKLLDELRGTYFYITTKLDGSSMTVFKLDGEAKVCSRNRIKDLNDESSTFVETAKRQGWLDKVPEGIAIQGELCGSGIQKNRLRLDEHKMFAFDAWDIKNGRYLNFSEYKNLLDSIGMTLHYRVPVQVLGNNFNYSLEQLLEITNGTYPGTSQPQEGIVVRPMITTYSPTLKGRLSFKVLNPTFLLKE